MFEKNNEGHKTGNYISPYNHGQFKKDEENESHPNLKFNSFKDKVTAMNLPDINDRETRLRLDKLRRMKDTKILISDLDDRYFIESRRFVEMNNILKLLNENIYL